MYPFVCVFAAALPQALCQDMFCSTHEFCGENSNGREPRCCCRAIFASKYRSTSTFGEITMTEEQFFHFSEVSNFWNECGTSKDLTQRLRRLSCCLSDKTSVIIYGKRENKTLHVYSVSNLFKDD